MSEVKGMGKNRFFMFQAFIIGVVLVVAMGLTRGIIYEEQLARAQYPPGIAVVGVAQKGLYSSLGPLPPAYIRAVGDGGGLLTEYWAADWNDGHDYLGTDHRYLEVFRPALRAGRYFSPQEQTEPVCLISERLAKELYGTVANSLGQAFSTPQLGVELTIVGVLEDGVELPVKTVDQEGSEQFQFRVASDCFVVYPAAARPLNDGPGVYRSIWLEGSVLDAARLAGYLEQLDFPASYIVNPLPARHVGDPQGRSILIAILVGFAFLVLIVAALGMFGMQMIQVLRRRGEIGLRMAVGALRRHILLQILRETMLTILVPSAAGAAAGFLLRPLLSRMALPMLFDGGLVVMVFGVMVLFTVLVGFYPAWKGASLDPIECLGRTPRLN